MNCYVYWIHAPHHTNIFEEGYIGISINPKKRFNCHKNAKQNSILENAFNKYEEMLLTVLLKADVNYCKNIEIILRPNDHIGWNINKGGGLPPIIRGKRPKEFGRKVSESKKKSAYKHSEETKEKISQTKKLNNDGVGMNNHFYGRKHSEETKQKIKLARAKQTNIKNQYTKV